LPQSLHGWKITSDWSKICRMSVKACASPG
jgi:hypothetical protein